ncbi:MAG: succinate dehydrogenase cytochrome b subunit [Caldilineaceae bacterium]|nr:succinate dehydrogenase cytochrome b subunit [Caldilineaceae bacterium]
MQAAALYRSSIGKKVVMAVTGLIWIGYVVLHMYGNLKAFQGAEYFNHYAEGLRDIGTPVFGHLHLLTIARLILIPALLLHIWSAYSLYLAARAARPVRYDKWRAVQANYAALSIRWGGVALLIFILFHLAQLTWGIRGFHTDFVRGDAYHNLIGAFQFWPVTLLYLVGVVALGLHLYHGTWSMFRTLGGGTGEWDGAARALAWLLAIVVPVGFAAVPLAVQFGFLS